MKEKLDSLVLEWKKDYEFLDNEVKKMLDGNAILTTPRRLAEYLGARSRLGISINQLESIINQPTP